MGLARVQWIIDQDVVSTVTGNLRLDTLRLAEPAAGVLVGPLGVLVVRQTPVRLKGVDVPLARDEFTALDRVAERDVRIRGCAEEAPARVPGPHPSRGAHRSDTAVVHRKVLHGEALVLLHGKASALPAAGRDQLEYLV